MPNKQQQALEILQDMRENKLKLFEPGTYAPELDEAHNAVKKEMINYINQLETKIKSTQDDSQLDNHIRSLRVLSLSSSGFALLNWGLVTMHNVGKFVTSEQHGDPKLLESIGKNVLETAKDFSALLNADSVSISSKAWIMMKAFTVASFSAVKGALNGIKEGFNQGKGLETISSMFQESVKGGASSFFKKIADSFSEQLQAKGIKPQAEITNEPTPTSTTLDWKSRKDAVYEGDKQPSTPSAQDTLAVPLTPMGMK